MAAKKRMEWTCDHCGLTIYSDILDSTWTPKEWVAVVVFGDTPGIKRVRPFCTVDCVANGIGAVANDVISQCIKYRERAKETEPS